MNPTEEQLAIVNAVKSGNKLLKIEAVAGSGKTSTGVLIETMIPSNTLYVAFNKSSAMDASKKFPNTTTCQTFHSIAYTGMKVSSTYSHKLTRKPGINCGQYTNEITKLFKIKDYNGVGANSISELIKLAVSTYQQSADLELSEKHVKIPTKIINLLAKHHGVLGDTIDSKTKRSINELKKKIFINAVKLWKERIDKTNNIVIDHDTYFKLFQLSKPKLNYKRIFLDEAQDTTDCALDIILNQDCQVIIVGDARQSIYEWRGACNAMNKIQTPTTLRLSKSWRYGETIAKLATKIANMPVYGNEMISSNIDINVPSKYTYIFRTNSELILSACELIASNSNILIDIDTTEFLRKLKSVVALKLGKFVMDDDIASYGDWNNFSSMSKPPELERIKKLVDENKARTIIMALEKYKKPTNPDIHLITAHRSKGMEYENVKLADDFPIPSLDKVTNVIKRLPEQEENLLYVAVTRAIKSLVINSAARKYIANFN